MLSHRLLIPLLSLLAPAAASAQCGLGEVLSHQKISDSAGGFTGGLADEDKFGCALASLGDLDGDGVVDLAVGAYQDSDAGFWQGGVWVLFLEADGTVKSHVQIIEGNAGFTGTLANGDNFGWAVENLGDLNRDGVVDLAVGAHWDNDGGPSRGAVWILYLNANGTVAANQKISSTAGGFSGALDDNDRFGCALANLGDLDGDGSLELAVGAFRDDDGDTDRGAVWVLSLAATGTVIGHTKISDTQSSFAGTLSGTGTDYEFGYSLDAIGDLDGDGCGDLVAGAYYEPGGGSARGGVWVLFLDEDADVVGQQLITDGQGGFLGPLQDFDRFGNSVEGLGDFDGDGVLDMAVGAWADDEGIGSNRGGLWIFFMRPDGAVRAHQKISDTQGNFSGKLAKGDGFGSGVTSLGDLNGDGVQDLAVGAMHDSDDGFRRGAVYVLRLNDRVTDTIALTGPGTAVAGQAVTLEWSGAPASSPAWLYASGGIGGSLIQGQTFDVGPAYRTLDTSLTSPAGTGSWSSFPFAVPQRAAALSGRTVYFELRADDAATGQTCDSNAEAVTLP